VPSGEYRWKLRTEGDQCMNRHLRFLLLLWPWPWRDDLRIRTWPIFLGDTPGVSNMNFIRQDFRNLSSDVQTCRQTDRQTDRHDWNYIPCRFAGGQNRQCSRILENCGLGRIGHCLCRRFVSCVYVIRRPSLQDFLCEEFT